MCLFTFDTSPTLTSSRSLDIHAFPFDHCVKYNSNMKLAQDSLVTDAVRLIANHAFFVIACVFVACALHIQRSYARLQHIPGPFPAAISNLVRFYWVRTRRAQHIHIDLHRQYGPLVRFGPNMVSIGDPSEISKIYGFKGTYIKVSGGQTRWKAKHANLLSSISQVRILSGIAAI